MMNMFYRIGRHFAMAYVAGSLWAGLASAQQTNNYQMHAVPVPGAVVVDGKLEEWDRSGEILMCYDIETMLDTNSVRAWAMYDADHLYLAFHFKDRTPMVNHIDPANQPGEGWRSDAIQLRILPAPDAVPVHVDAYYFTDRKEPVVYLQHSFMGWRGQKENRPVADALDQGAQEAFVEDADGQGYVQELALPWKLIMPDGQAPKPGQSIRMGIEMFWGNPSGGDKGQMQEHRLADLLNMDNPKREFFWNALDAWGELKLSPTGKVAPAQSVQMLSKVDQLRELRYRTQGPVAIDYELPADGYATLVIEKPDGTRVRNLVSGYPRKAGKNVDYWDGRDDQGKLMPQGTYTVRGLYRGEFDALYEFSFGNPGDPQWPTADSTGSWLSDHCAPMAALADEKHVYITSPHAEEPHPLIALDAQGDKAWGGLARWYGGYMARSGDYLYVLNEKFNRPASKARDLEDDSPIQLIRVDPATGREVAFPDGKSKQTLATWNLYKQGASRPWIGQVVQENGFDADWAGNNAQGMTALEGVLYVSLHFEDKLLKVDAKTGKVTGDIALPRPAGLVADDKRLLAISGEQVMEVNPATGKAVPLITTNLKAPIDLALDKQGNIYVSDWADQMCVKVFSPTGKYLKHIGTMGGRALIGEYQPQGMIRPRGITIDAQNRLWVAEADFQPRRVSCWNTDTGALEIERLGQTGYGGLGARVLPDDPTRAIMLGNLLELDWDNGRWRVLGTPWRPTGERTFLGLDDYGNLGDVIHHQGRRFLIHSINGPHSDLTGISEFKDGLAIPLAAAGWAFRAIPNAGHHWEGGTDIPKIIADNLWTLPQMNQAAQEVVPWGFHGPRAGHYRSVRSEIVKTVRKTGMNLPNKTPNSNLLWSDLDRDGSVDDDEIIFHATPGLRGKLPPKWLSNMWSRGVVDDELSIYQTAVDGKKSYHYKLPVARWTDSGVPVYDLDKVELITKTRNNGRVSWISDEGKILAYGVYSTGLMTLFNPDGSVAWTYPSKYTGVHGSHAAPKTKHGLIVGELGVMGDATRDNIGQFFGIHTNMGTAEFMTADGLYLGSVFRDTRSAPDAWPDQPRRGMSMGKVTQGAEWFDGQMFQRPDNGEVYVVGGRSAGVIMRIAGLDTVERLPDQTIRFDGKKAKPHTPLVQSPAVKNIAIQAIPGPKAFTPTRHAWASWDYDDKRSAQATWTYDDKNLYVYFKVKDDSPMTNHGEDVTRLFKFGDAALLELRTQPDDDSQKVIPGDLRLLFSLYQDKPVAVVYDYRVPGTKEPVKFSSPVTTTPVDRVEVLRHANVKIDRTADGYALRAAVPLSDLKFKPDPGKRYRGDFGIVYSDQQGTKNLLRMNWSNQKTGLVSDLPMETIIAPDQWGWFNVTKPQ